MSVFVDTSAFLSVLDSDDPNNAAASAAWAEKIRADEKLVTTNYVVVETVAVLRRRHGAAAVRWFVEDMLPVVYVEWVDREIHLAAMRSLVAGSRNGPSLVDCVSLEMIDKHGIDEVFVFDRHFEERGLHLIGRTSDQ